MNDNKQIIENFNLAEIVENIREGRQHLGDSMPVLIYRLFEYSIKSVLEKEFGIEKANELFRQAGYQVGYQYALQHMPLDAQPGDFIATLSDQMEQLKVGIIRFEMADFEKNEFVITVYEDLDCSGLPVSNEVVCNYDEGLLAGILEAYTGNKVIVREVDCWASGERVCRFKGKVTDEA